MTAPLIVLAEHEPLQPSCCGKCNDGCNECYTDCYKDCCTDGLGNDSCTGQCVQETIGAVFCCPCTVTAWMCGCK